MSAPTKVKSKIIMALLPPGVTIDNQRMRRSRGHEVEAEGWLQPVANRLVQEVATSMEVAKAAGIVAKALPRWSDAISLIEADASRQIHLVVAVLNADRFQIGVGELPTELAKVPPSAKSLVVVSINKVLAELRRDAKTRGIELPERLTPPLGSFEYVQWRIRTDPEEEALLRAFYEAKQQERAKQR